MNPIPFAPALLSPSRQFGRLRFRLFLLVTACGAELAFASLAHATSVQGGVPSLEQRVATLEALVSTLQTANSSLLAQVTALQTSNSTLQSDLAAVQSTLSPVKRVGNDFIFEGCNVHIRSGSGATDGPLNGLGNLIIGYGEPSPVGSDRSGSHNLVVGKWNSYTSYGGLVAGEFNETDGPAASVTGGSFNVAFGAYSAVNGGFVNVASGQYSTVNGGSFNAASGDASTVGGGVKHLAPDEWNWVAGALFEQQ